MNNDLLAFFQREYQGAPDDTYTNDMHRALLHVLASMDARIRELEAQSATRRAESPVQPR
jgi:hypothetical protein